MTCLINGYDKLLNSIQYLANYEIFSLKRGGVRQLHPLKRMYTVYSRDKDQTWKTHTLNKEHNITKTIHTKKQK